MSGYQLHVPFWTHQQKDCFLKSLKQPRFCLFMEPRTGKSKPIVDKSCYHFEWKSSPLHITGVLIIAFPNGVHAGWIKDAFPDNVPKRLPWAGLIWRPDKCRQVGYRKQFEKLCAFKGLAVFSVNVESLASAECRSYIMKFLEARGRVHIVGDESSCFVEPNAKRTQFMMELGRSRAAIMMSILDGTPVDRAGPTDYYSQVGWMGHDILGYTNPVEFRAHFTELVTQGRSIFWGKVKEIREKKIAEGFAKPIAQEIAIRVAKGESVEEEVAPGKKIKRRLKRGRDYWTVEAKDDDGFPKFRNMDELWRKLEPISYRATFRDCFPNAKSKVYQKRYFELTSIQREVYDAIQEEHKATIDGEEIEVLHTLTRLLRAQQITSNYYPERKVLALHDACAGMGCELCSDTGIVENTVPMKVIDASCNPRLDALALELKTGKPAVVWCRFTQDVDQCMALAESMGLRPCRYDGQTGPDAKEDSKEGFQAGRYGTIIGNELSLSRGIPLWRAELMVGYSNMFSYRTRRQVEERSEHGSKTTATELVDLVAEETVDDLSIIPALRLGMDVSTYVLQDSKREWI